VGLIVQSDGTLLVTKKVTEEPLQKVKEIDSSTVADPAYLFRLLIGTYITGYNVIRITTKQRFPPFVRTVVRDFTQMTIGQEVVEETETVIAIKDLLNPAEMPFDNTIKRMFVMSRTCTRMPSRHSRRTTRALPRISLHGTWMLTASTGSLHGRQT